MKVYVDELPKSCGDCDFGYANNFCELDYDLDLREFDKNQKHTKCPLQPLADHDKQVRKEVCEEIGEQLGLRVDGKWQVVCDGCMTGDKTIMAVLDQIGETK